MSKDIRSFFTPIFKKAGTSPKPSEDKKKSSEKRSSKKRQKSADSSIDDVIPETPDVDKKTKKRKNEKPEVKRRRIAVVSDSESDREVSPTRGNKNKRPLEKKLERNGSKHPQVVSDSDSEKEKSKSRSKAPALNKLMEEKKEAEKPKKMVNPFDAFGSEPVQQTKTEKPKAPVTELNIHDDDAFEKTLLDIDEGQLVNSTPSKPKREEPKRKPSSETDSEKKEPKTPKREKGGPLKSTDSPSTSTPGRKRKVSEGDPNDSVASDLERYEKKKHSAMRYQKFLNRSGPAHPGSKWLPRGKADCLKDDSFIITGVLDSLTREDCENLIVEHGGRCVKSLSGKTKYMVLGDDAGPAKLEKAQKLGTKMLSEDDLIDLICSKSEIENKNVSDTKTQISETEIKKEKNSENKKNNSKVGSPVKKSASEEKADGKKQANKDSEDNKSTIIKEEIDIAKEMSDDEIPAVTVKKEPIGVTIKPKQSQQKPSTITATDPKAETAVKETPQVQLAWVDKYRPTDMKQIIGQQTEGSNARKLMSWLKNWYRNHDGKTKLVKPSPWAKNDNGAFFKAALLSGPPGVGKTTTANVVSRGLGFDVVEFNASDTRSKKMLHEEVSMLLKSRSLAGYFADGSAPTSKHVLLMDEVDGMSGNEDRGGMQELINLIKSSCVPVICMCNDRQHQKVRSLANYCFDLRFAKPRLEQIKGAMMSVCFKEDVKISPEALNDVILGSGMDIRQILNNLSMWSAKDSAVSKDAAKRDSSVAVKDVKLGPWEVIRKVFSEDDHKNMSTQDKYDLFFYDYSINPLFVQENYLQVKPHCPSNEMLKRVAYAADSISLGDLVDTKIRSNQSWGLLDTQALFSSVIPGECMEGHMAGQINFPGWLGKNSKTNKFKRMLSELQSHMRTSISGSRQAVNLDYLSHIYNALVSPLVKDGMEGIPRALAVMQEYHLMREDLTNITELVHWPKSKDLFKNVEPKVKAAFTRAYNKDVTLPYAVSTVPIKKRRAGAEEEDMYGDEEADESSGEENDNIDNNPMIKVKKATAKAESKTTKGKETKAKAPAKPRTKKGKS